MDRSKLFQQLCTAFWKAFTDKSKKVNQEQATLFWNELKKSCPLEFEIRVKRKIEELEARGRSKKAKLMSFWAVTNGPELKTSTVDASLGTEKSVSVELVAESSGSTPISINSVKHQDRPKPAQQALNDRISMEEAKLSILNAQYVSGLGMVTKYDAIKASKEVDKLKKMLNAKILKAKSTQKLREKKRLAMISLIEDDPSLAEKLKSQLRSKPGRPRLEENQQGLMEAIQDLAIYGGAAADKRRSEAIRSCRTLDDLHVELKKMGFMLRRSGTYLRLLPRNSASIEGRRHVSTVPVKLKRASNDCHKSHPDQYFCTATINSLEELASILCPNILWISQNDKCRVPIGLTACNKQSPFLMHFEYQVRLPDHDWVIAAKHKLIPSVYAIIKIESGRIGNKAAVGYSGPTYICVRSGKHDSSTAVAHAQDLKNLLNEEIFSNFVKTTTGHIKPIIIITVDGGPDENPRYWKVIHCAIQTFKENNLDALYIATNAPGRSAYNRVERRMAPLSRELSGVILPHEHFGSNLNAKGETVDERLETANFEYAGNILANIWSGMMIDKFLVTTVYVKPSDTVLDDPAPISPQWMMNHVRESQYLLQIVRCDNKECCRPWRSQLKSILPDHFLPNPIPVIQAANGLVVQSETNTVSTRSLFLPLMLNVKLNSSTTLKKAEVSLFKLPPYDLFCPSVQDKLEQRCCINCGIYHASVRSINAHSKVHKQEKRGPKLHEVKVRPVRIAARKQRELMVVWRDALNEENVEWLDEDEVEVSISNQHDNGGPGDVCMPKKSEQFPIIKNMEVWLESPWEDL